MFRFMLAPMEEHTDSAFRTLCFRHGADLTFTEMAKIDGLARNNKPTLSKALRLDSTPTQIQILPGRDEMLDKYLKNFKPSEGFMGFNFNFGCPAPEVQKVGRGSAMVKRVTKANRLIAIVRKYNYPVSLKIRLGASAFEKSVKVYMNLINGTNPDFFVVHARTGEDTYAHKPDYSVFEECVSSGKEIIANGDIQTPKELSEVKKMGVKGVMIGRAAICNPAIFDLLKGKEVPSFEELKKEYSLLAKKYNSSPRHKKNILMRIGQKFAPTYIENKM